MSCIRRKRFLNNRKIREDAKTHSKYGNSDREWYRKSFKRYDKRKKAKWYY